MRPSLPITYVLLALSATSALAQGFPREGVQGIENGKSAPFAGEWAMGFPQDYDSNAIVELVGCDAPVVIAAIDETHITHVGPNAGEVDPAIELIAASARTHWVPMAGGASYVTVWRDADTFYLYELAAIGEADWSRPLLYNRC